MHEINNKATNKYDIRVLLTKFLKKVEQIGVKFCRVHAWMSLERSSYSVLARGVHYLDEDIQVPSFCKF